VRFTEPTTPGSPGSHLHFQAMRPRPLPQAQLANIRDPLSSTLIVDVFCSIVDWLQVCSHLPNERPQRPESSRVSTSRKPVSATCCRSLWTISRQCTKASPTPSGRVKYERAQLIASSLVAAQNGGKRGQSLQWSASGRARGCPISLTTHENHLPTARAVRNHVPSRRAGVCLVCIGTTPFRTTGVFSSPARNGGRGAVNKRDFFGVRLGFLMLEVDFPKAASCPLIPVRSRFSPVSIDSGHCLPSAQSYHGCLPRTQPHYLFFWSANMVSPRRAVGASGQNGPRARD